MKRNTNRRRMLIAAIVTAVVLTAACSTKGTKNTGEENSDAISMEQNMPGDSTVYGLACDGCNDTILVFLPRSGGDPDTFNILNASKQRQVMGWPMIGDKIAVVVNRENPKVADLVIDMEQLKGEWCYMVEPELRQVAGMSQAARQKQLKEESDSMFRELMQPREYGMEIKSGYICRPIGMVRNMTSDEESPVVYPPLKRYREWRLFNGKLLLSESTRDSTGNATVTNIDTAQFVMMRRDTLVLRFSDGEQGYYRRPPQTSQTSPI